LYGNIGSQNRLKLNISGPAVLILLRAASVAFTFRFCLIALLDAISLLFEPFRLRLYLDDTFLNSCLKLNISNNSCCSRMSLLKRLYLCLAFYSYRSATAKKRVLLVFNVLLLSICDSKEKSSPLKIGGRRMCQ